MIQSRLFAVWRGGLCGVGPVSVGLGVAITTSFPSMPLCAWLLAFFVGLIAVSKTLPLFARFSGMSVIRPG